MMKFAGGYGGDPVNSEEYTHPAFMFNTGILVLQTQNQRSVFKTAKSAAQIVQVPNTNQVDAGTAMNEYGM